MVLCGKVQNTHTFARREMTQVKVTLRVNKSHDLKLYRPISSRPARISLGVCLFHTYPDLDHQTVRTVWTV